MAGSLKVNSCHALWLERLGFRQSGIKIIPVIALHSGGLVVLRGKWRYEDNDH